MRRARTSIYSVRRVTTPSASWPRRDDARRALALLALLAVALGALAGCGANQHDAAHTPSRLLGDPVDWATFGYTASRSGFNDQEYILTPRTVGKLRALWKAQLPATNPTAPVLLSGIQTPDGAKRDLLYSLTRDGRLVAQDVSSGAILWSARPEGQGAIRSAPVADAARRVVYAYGLDGALHQYGATDGHEVTIHGWPVRVTATPQTTPMLSAPNIANDELYVTTSAPAGSGAQGTIVTISTDPNTQVAKAHTFNLVCSEIRHTLAQGECAATGAGVNALGGAVVDVAQHSLFVATGPGAQRSAALGGDFGESLLNLLDIGGSLIATDAYLAPPDSQLAGAPTLLPAFWNGYSEPLLAQGAQDGSLRVFTEAAPGSPVETLPATNCAPTGQPAIWTNPVKGPPDAVDPTSPPPNPTWLYVPTSCGLDAYTTQFDAQGRPSLTHAWRSDLQLSSPVVAGGVVFAAERGASGRLVALDPLHGQTLWTSPDGDLGAIQDQSPIVVNGALYCADEAGRMVAYAIW